MKKTNIIEGLEKYVKESLSLLTTTILMCTSLVFLYIKIFSLKFF